MYDPADFAPDGAGYEEWLEKQPIPPGRFAVHDRVRIKFGRDRGHSIALRGLGGTSRRSDAATDRKGLTSPIPRLSSRSGSIRPPNSFNIANPVLTD